MSLSFPSQELPPVLRCRNHPDREGIGICVGCRAVVCVECSTRIDRMNYCTACLEAARAPEDRPEARPFREATLGWLLLGLSFAGAAGIFWLLGLVTAALRRLAPGGLPS